MSNQIKLLLCLMVIPITILIFCDIAIFKINLYLILHISLATIYFIFFYLFQKINEGELIELPAHNIIAPSAPSELSEYIPSSSVIVI
jgi:hypothetical protein